MRARMRRAVEAVTQWGARGAPWAMEAAGVVVVAVGVERWAEGLGLVVVGGYLALAANRRDSTK